MKNYWVSPNYTYTQRHASTLLISARMQHQNLQILTSYFLFFGAGGKAPRPPYWGRGLGTPLKSRTKLHNHNVKTPDLAAYEFVLL